MCSHAGGIVVKVPKMLVKQLVNFNEQTLFVSHAERKEPVNVAPCMKPTLMASAHELPVQFTEMVHMTVWPLCVPSSLHVLVPPTEAWLKFKCVAWHCFIPSMARKAVMFAAPMFLACYLSPKCEKFSPTLCPKVLSLH